MRLLAPSRVLQFGAGGTKGGIKKINVKQGSTYTKWALSDKTRRALAPLHHELIPEYLIRLHEKRCALEKWQEVHVADPTGQKDFINKDGSSFDYVEWNKKYRDELSTAQSFSECVQKLEENMTLQTKLMEMSRKGEAGSAKDEEMELLPLAEQDIKDLMEEIKSMDSEIEKIMSRRLAREDLIGGSSQTWQLSVAGKAGGEEANLFAMDLVEMFKSYCRLHQWKVSDPSDEGEGKQRGGGGDATATPSEGITLVIHGESVYRYMHHEIGVHKVQRVPVTDAAGKMQTSTAVVKLTPILNPVSVQVYESDCKIDFVRGSGPGGQGMQSSSNCVVLTHLPSGISVKCHQSRSALGNKELALQMVSQQLLARRVRAQNSSLHEAWENQWSSGERSDKMRTYNYPQNRVTDHRLGKDFALTQFMEGGTALHGLHDELNQISDVQELSTALLRHIEGNFGSEE